MTVRHFVTELTGGTGVASLRLHVALARQGIDSTLHHRFGSSSTSHVTIDPRHRWWPWRLWQGYVISRRWRRQNPERGIFIHSRWIYPSRLRDFGQMPDVVNLHPGWTPSRLVVARFACCDRRLHSPHRLPALHDPLPPLPESEETPKSGLLLA